MTFRDVGVAKQKRCACGRGQISSRTLLFLEQHRPGNRPSTECCRTPKHSPGFCLVRGFLSHFLHSRHALGVIAMFQFFGGSISKDLLGQNFQFFRLGMCLLLLSVVIRCRRNNRCVAVCLQDKIPLCL